MCWCTPERKTPWCGRPECYAPGRPPPKSRKQLEEEYKTLTENKKTVHQGWECPKCHSIWSPNEKKCTVCVDLKGVKEDVAENKPQLLLE